MKKIRLDLGGLSVETFRVDASPLPHRGTVAANEDTENTCPNTNKTCNNYDTGCWCYPNYYSDPSCYAACDTGWTGPGYASCAPGESCGVSCEGSCQTQIC
jgi:hypothetical protein